MDDLYGSDLLALAANLPRLGRLPAPDGTARARSMVCGSEVEVTVALDAAGRIADLGLELEACALGQASAAIFARAAIGADGAEIAAAREALAGFLQGAGPAPTGRFEGLAQLSPVQGYPRRHASVLLPWRAGADAVANATAAKCEAAQREAAQREAAKSDATSADAMRGCGPARPDDRRAPDDGAARPAAAGAA